MPADRDTIVVEVSLLVEVEPVHDAESGPQGRREQTGARGRADQRERRHRHLHRPRAGPLPDHDVDLEVLHRRIEELLDDRTHAVHFVDEEHIALLEIGQDARQIAGLLERRPRRGAHRRAELVGNDVGQRRLAQPRRAVEQHVIERLAALARGRDRNDQVLAHALLADVVAQRPRTQPRLVLGVVVDP